MILYYSATGNTEYIAKELASRLDDECIGCGKCEKLCPLNNVTLENNVPVWAVHCSHCMACIGNCPVRAIEYGNITQEKE